MFRLHRSDRLAGALILLAAALGVMTLWDGTGDAVRALALTETPPPARSPDPAPVRGHVVPLEIGSRDTGLPVVGRYAGWLSLEDGDLVFRVPRATVRTRAASAGERRLVGVRLVLARKSGTGWTTVAEGPLLSFRAGPEHGREHGRRVELRIRDVGPSDLRDTWPVLVHELELRPDDPTVLPITVWTYVHGTRDPLDALRRKVDAVGD